MPYFLSLKKFLVIMYTHRTSVYVFVNSPVSLAFFQAWQAESGTTKTSGTIPIIVTTISQWRWLCQGLRNIGCEGFCSRWYLFHTKYTIIQRVFPLRYAPKAGTWYNRRSHQKFGDERCGHSMVMGAYVTWLHSIPWSWSQRQRRLRQVIGFRGDGHSP